MVRYQRNDRAAYSSLSAERRRPLDRVATRIQAAFRGHSFRGNWRNPYMIEEQNRNQYVFRNLMYERGVRRRRNERRAAADIASFYANRMNNAGILHNLPRIQSFIGPEL